MSRQPRLIYSSFFLAIALSQVPRWAESWSTSRSWVGGTLQPRSSSLLTTMMSSPKMSMSKTTSKLLVLGGTGFLGQAVCKRAIIEGYEVTSLSRRGLPPYRPDNSADTKSTLDKVDYRQGDALVPESINNILNEGGYVGIVHCIGLLFDDESGLGELNQFVSGSGSLPSAKSSYDTITRQTAFNAIECAIDYTLDAAMETPLPFCFTSAAEAGWPDVPGGEFVERRLTPDFLKRYLAAKRAVESKLMQSKPKLRPIIARPSLIYSMDRPESFVSVGAFFFLNGIGAPFVDRPVTVQSLAAAMVRGIGSDSISGVLRYPEIDRLSQ